MPSISDHCKECGLHKKCASPFLHLQEFKKKTGVKKVLVVGAYPGPEEDRGGAFNQTPAGKQLEECFSVFKEHEVTYHAPLSCPSPVEKPTPDQLKLCRKHTFEFVIRNHRPKVICCFGVNALRWVLGTDEEIKISDYLHSPFYIKSSVGEHIVLVGQSLNNDFRFCPTWQRRIAPDLMEATEWILRQARQLSAFEGRWEPPTKRTVHVHTEKEALEWAHKMRRYAETYMDTETAQNERNPEAITINHPRALHLLTSWCFRTISRYGAEAYLNIVIHDAANTRKVNKLFFEGDLIPDPGHKKPKRVVWIHNKKFDNRVFWAKHGLKPHEIDADIRCTLQRVSLRDQSGMSNGLKKQAKFYFNADDWDSRLKAQVRKIQTIFQSKMWKKFIARDPLWKKASSKTGDELKTQINDILDLARTLRDNDVPTQDCVWADYRHVNQIELGEYCGDDTYWLGRLVNEVIKPQYIHEDEDYKRLVKFMDEAIDCLLRIEMQGCPLDLDVLQEEAEKNQALIKKMCKEFFSMKLVQRANPKMFADKYKKATVESLLGCKAFLHELVRVTRVSVPLTKKSGEPSLKKEVKYQLAAVDIIDESDLVEERTAAQEVWYKYLRITQAMSAHSKFFQGYPQHVLEDGAFHCTFNASQSVTEKGTSEGAKTGRLSSKLPQSQNLPKLKSIKKCFKAPNGWKILEADYGGAELRCLASFAKVRAMLESFKDKNVDYHLSTARKLFKDESLTKDTPQRSVSKNLNFGATYGQGVLAFAEKAKIPVEEARVFFNEFFKLNHEILTFYDEIDKTIRNAEKVKTVTGRRRSYRFVGDKVADERTKRQAHNDVVQGPASDITLIHLVEIYRWLDKNPKLHNIIKVINTVHDSVWFLVKEEYWEKVVPMIKKIMQDKKCMWFEFLVDLVVETEIGDNRAEMSVVCTDV